MFSEDLVCGVVGLLVGFAGIVLLGAVVCSVAEGVVFVSIEEVVVVVEVGLSFGGEIDRCGVMMSGIDLCGTETDCALPSRVCVAAGVNGGECTADTGGERCGETFLDPALEPGCTAG